MPGPTSLPAAIVTEAPERPRRAWKKTAAYWLAGLACYWLALFASTHLRMPDIPGPIWDFDKVLHAGAYFVLATLCLIAARRIGSTTSWRTQVTIAMILLAYGAIDEITQQYVGRQCSVYDWLADAAGVAIALGLDRWRHRRD